MTEPNRRSLGELAGPGGWVHMHGPAPADEHVQHVLGVYVLGALSAEDAAAVEEHLIACPACTAEANDLFEVRSLLDLLPREEMDAVLNRPRQDRTPKPRKAVVRPGRSSPRDAVVKEARPTARPPGRTDSRRQRIQWAGRARLIVTAVVVALAVGIGVGVWVTARSPVDITLTGSENNTATGVSLSVTVVASPEGRAHVSAIVRGLTAGASYQLYAINAQGKAELVAAWVAVADEQSVQGDTRIPTDQLAYFAAARSGGGVLVTVRVAPSPRGP